ncbi:MAG: HAD family phosphatase [Rhodospirillales bacterium]|nr:HAD family phosphatase [Alphaproteobacteria bacterium]MCB9986451.1 HAD family phosphatase [Rhodospirillales bacterium]USO07003.1 MAG: HAD family phosphatase [Rhodospirillales bacterium]
MNKTVVFDVGGVLIDWNPEYLYRRLIPEARAREAFLKTVCTRAWNAQQDLGRSWADAVRERIAAFPEHESLIRAYDENWHEMVAGLVPGTSELKDNLRARGVKVFALTNFSAEKWTLAQSLWPTLARFDGVVCSGVERVAKPDPAIYRVLFNRHALDPAACLFIDDLPANVAAARDLGMRGHVFTNAGALADTLAAFLA